MNQSRSFYWRTSIELRLWQEYIGPSAEKDAMRKSGLRIVAQVAHRALKKDPTLSSSAIESVLAADESVARWSNAGDRAAWAKIITGEVKPRPLP